MYSICYFCLSSYYAYSVFLKLSPINFIIWISPAIIWCDYWIVFEYSYSRLRQLLHITQWPKTKQCRTIRSGLFHFYEQFVAASSLISIYDTVTAIAKHNNCLSTNCGSDWLRRTTNQIGKLLIGHCGSGINDTEHKRGYTKFHAGNERKLLVTVLISLPLTQEHSLYVLIRNLLLLPIGGFFCNVMIWIIRVGW